MIISMYVSRKCVLCCKIVYIWVKIYVAKNSDGKCLVYLPSLKMLSISKNICMDEKIRNIGLKNCRYGLSFYVIE